MGYLAVELLIEQAGIDVLLDINRLMPIKGNWDAAFEEAVGMTTDEFYTLFAEWLPEQQAHTQSSSSSQGARGFVFLGEVPAERQQEIRDRYTAIQTHFADHYDIERMGATINIAATFGRPDVPLRGRGSRTSYSCTVLLGHLGWIRAGGWM